MTPTQGTFLIAILAAGAVGIGAWVMGDFALRAFGRWRTRLQSEAEFELTEMLYQLPARAFINYSMGAAVGGGIGMTLLVLVLSGPWSWKPAVALGLLTSGLVLFSSRFCLRLLRRQRLERFNDQLEESLMGMSNSLKAGFSIIQAIEMVIRQNRQPISIEFNLMLQQTKLGMSFDDALKNMAARVHSEDFDLVGNAIRTARVTGGDLTGIFDRLAAMIRERRRIQRRVMTLTAQGRLQGRILGALPMLLMLVLFFMDPSLIKSFLSQPLGIVLLLFVIVLETCGFLVIRRIVNIDI